MLLKGKLLIFNVLILFILMLLTAGCDNSWHKEKATVAISSELFNRHNEREYFVNKILDPLSKELGINIDFIGVGDSTNRKRVDYQKYWKNVTIDIAIVSSGTMSNWITEGYLEDLTDTVKEWKFANFLPVSKIETIYKCRTYFIPLVGNVYLLIANKKALKYLPDNTDINNLTWDEFAQWAINIKKYNGFGKTLMCGASKSSFTYQFGSCAISYGSEFPSVGSPGALKAWEIFSKIADANAFVPNVRVIANPIESMQNEKAWISVLGNYSIGEICDLNPNRYVIADMPNGTAGKGVIFGFSGMALLKSSKQKEKAIQIIKYLSRPDIQLKIARGTGGYIPAEIKSLKSLNPDRPRDLVIIKAVNELFSKIVAYGIPSGKYKDWNSVKEVFDELFQKYLLSGKDLNNKILKEASEKLNNLKRKE